MLGALRGFASPIATLRQNKWKGSPAAPLGHDPEGNVLGILGMGGIGRDLKKKAEAFGVKVQYHNRRRLSEELAGGAKYVSFEELLKTSDVLHLSLPLNVCIALSIRILPSRPLINNQTNRNKPVTSSPRRNSPS